MAPHWIVHRDPRQRAALARLAGAGEPAEPAVLGAPTDPIFETAPFPSVVVLGLAGDLEAELSFAHRHARRLRDAAWVLLPRPGEAPRARHLFDILDAEVLASPADARTLGWRLRTAPARRGGAPLSLSERAARDTLASRVSRWFGDLELPELLRAIDPKRYDAPLHIEGEPGLGRGLLVRYVHAFGGTQGGALARVACREDLAAEALFGALRARTRTRRGRRALAVWLEDAERLAPELQRAVAEWIEAGLPDGVAPTRRVRWLGTAESPLEPELASALGGLVVRIPPLRERRGTLAGVARDCALAWCDAHGAAPRELAAGALAALGAHDWPGNLRELEAVVVHSLVASDADPLTAADLVHAGRPFAPVAYAPSVGTAPEPAVDAEPTPGPEPEVEPEPQPEAPPDAEPVLPVEAVGELVEEPEAAGGVSPLARALSHELRNPLTSIRTLAQLLPERHDDPEFRETFSRLVESDLGRVHEALSRLSRLAELPEPRREPVEVTHMLAGLLESRLDVIRRRRLLVMEELDPEHPFALGDTEQLHFALESLLDQCLALVPDRGELFVVSGHSPASAGGGGARLRVLLRCQGVGEGAGADPEAGALAPARHSLAFAVAEAVIRAQGGSFAVDPGESETVVVLELPAPEA